MTRHPVREDHLALNERREFCVAILNKDRAVLFTAAEKWASSTQRLHSARENSGEMSSHSEEAHTEGRVVDLGQAGIFPTFTRTVEALRRLKSEFLRQWVNLAKSSFYIHFGLYLLLLWLSLSRKVVNVLVLCRFDQNEPGIWLTKQHHDETPANNG